MSNATQLRNLILDQPDDSPLRLAFAGGRDYECELILNDKGDPSRMMPNDPPIGTFIGILRFTGVWAKIKSVALGQGLASVPEAPINYRLQLMNAAEWLINLELSPQYSVIEGSKALPLLQAFVTFGLETEEIATPAMQLLTRQASIIELEFGAGAYKSHLEVAECRIHA